MHITCMMFVIHKTSRFVVWRSWTDILKQKNNTFHNWIISFGLFKVIPIFTCINSYPPSCPHQQVKISIAIYGGANPGVITQELLPAYLQTKNKPLYCQANYV